jgi:flagellar FliL protein
MADNRDELDLEGSEPIGDSSQKKVSGLAALLPSILKFAAIGIGALIFIVTVSIITYRIMSGAARARPSFPPPNRIRPSAQYSWFTTIGVIRTERRIRRPYSVVVNVIIGYDQDSKIAQSELTTGFTS